MLIAAGADLEAVNDNGLTALMIAAHYGNYQIAEVRILVESRFD